MSRDIMKAIAECIEEDKIRSLSYGGQYLLYIHEEDVIDGEQYCTVVKSKDEYGRAITCHSKLSRFNIMYTYKCSRLEYRFITEFEQVLEDTYFYVLAPKVETILGISFTSYSNDSDMHYAKCHVVEERYKVSDGYKIELRSDDPNYPVHETFYQCDFQSSLGNSIVPILSKDMRVVKVSDIEHIDGAAYILTEGETITGMTERDMAILSKYIK